MNSHLVVTVVGVFVLDEENNIINTRNFPLSSEKVAAIFSQIDKGELPAILTEIAKEHKTDVLVTQNAKVGHLLAANGYKVQFEYFDPLIANFHKSIETMALEMGYFKSKEAFRKFVREVALFLTKERVRQAADKRDRLVVHAIETIDDVDKTLNLFSNRLREFYGMHFPELVDAIDNHHTFAKIVSKTGDKKNIDLKLLVNEIGLPKEKANRLMAARETSMGSSLLSQDIQLIQEQAQTIVNLYRQRQSLEKWMEVTMQTIAPNISGVISPLLGARLISLAGSLRDLALSPSSKIQVLGAEKALYRTIKTGAPPPKHGIIYQDPRLNQAKWWQRGKIARVLSSRISVAARLDYFEAGDKSLELVEETNKRINEIISKYPEPPKGKKQKQSAGQQYPKHKKPRHKGQKKRQ